MRFHSVNDARKSKEPWKFGSEAEEITKSFLRFRHRMIPYTYTMNRLNETEGRPLVMPLYYAFPKEDMAYRMKNEYFFGTQLIAAPITKKADRKTRKASVEIWLPEARYTDIFTGEVYGGGKTTIYRDIASIPVLAPAGAIIPLDGSESGNSCKNPDSIEVLIYRGNGRFTLYEDNGETLGYKNGHYAETMFSVEEHEDGLSFTVSPAEGDLSLIPSKRKYIFSFRDVESADKISVKAGGEETKFELLKKYNGISVLVEGVENTETLSVTLKGVSVK